MSTLYVTGFSEMGVSASGLMPIPQFPYTEDQQVTFTGTQGTSAAFANNTYFIRVHTDGIAAILITAAGTAATTSHMRLAANQTEYFAVRPGWKISAITTT